MHCTPNLQQQRQVVHRVFSTHALHNCPKPSLFTSIGTGAICYNWRHVSKHFLAHVSPTTDEIASWTAVHIPFAPLCCGSAAPRKFCFVLPAFDTTFAITKILSIWVLSTLPSQRRDNANVSSRYGSVQGPHKKYGNSFVKI